MTVQGEIGHVKALDLEALERLAHTYTNYRISRLNIGCMRDLKQKLGFKSYDNLISFLIEVSNREGAIPPALKATVFRDTRPVILTGEPGSGKTFFAQRLLREALYPVFVIDVSHEYTDLERVDLGALFSLDWTREAERNRVPRLRFLPHRNVEVSASWLGGLI